MIPVLVLSFSGSDSESDRESVLAALLDFETAAVHELSDREWRLFFRSGEERDRAAHVVRAWAEVTSTDIPDEDWARRTQQELKAVAVGRLLIAPPWDIPSAAPNDADGPSARDHIVIIIEPSMGFGTGHHATTRLCLRSLQRLGLHGKRVLDVGTGSGVLAIAASRLGAASVTAVDNDPDALDAARANAQRNDVTIELLAVDLENRRLNAADVVLANLTGAMLQRSAGRLAALARGGVLIVSGLLNEEADAVTTAFAQYSSEIERQDEAGWTSLTLTIP